MEQSIEYSSAQPQQAYHSPSSSYENRLAQLEQKDHQLEETAPRTDKITLLVFTGELDKVLAGLMIATTVTSPGMNSRCSSRSGELTC